jgi:hypothetical protein
VSMSQRGLIPRPKNAAATAAIDAHRERMANLPAEPGPPPTNLSAPGPVQLAPALTPPTAPRPVVQAPVVPAPAAPTPH